MVTRSGGLIVVGFFLLTSSAWGAVLGTGTADGSGGGTITFPVDASLDPRVQADELTRNVQLSSGATPSTVSVEDGVATIAYEGADPDATVEATMDEEQAKAAGLLPAAGGAAVAGGGGAGGGGGALAGVSTGAVVGGGLLAVTGGVLGGLAAAGQFDGDRTPRVISPAQ